MNIKEIIAGHRLTIKFSRSKYEEILKNLSEANEGEESNSDNQSANHFNAKDDLKEQAKMLKISSKSKKKKQLQNLAN